MVNTIYLISLGLVTLPLYSIAVQMGGDFKPLLLSPSAPVSLEIAKEANIVHDKHVRTPFLDFSKLSSSRLCVISTTHPASQKQRSCPQFGQGQKT